MTGESNLTFDGSSLDVFNGSNSSTIKLKRHASTASEQAHIGYFSSGLHIETREATDLSLKTNTQERLRILSDGKVIIGNTTGTQPSATVGGAQFYGGSYPGDFRISSGAGASGTTTASIAIMGSNHNASIENGANSGAHLNLYNYNTTDGNSSGIMFLNSNGLSASRILGLNVSHSSRTGALVLMTSNGSHPTEKFRIDNYGNAGLGVIPRTGAGGINNDTNVYLAIGDDDTGIAQDGDGQLELWANNQEIANFNASSITFTKTLQIPQTLCHVADTDTNISFPQDDYIEFDTAGTKRLQITNTGQIRIDQGTSANNGIRMRPSGWNYDFRFGAVSSSGGSIWLGQNYDPTSGAKDSSSYGTNYLRFTTNGEIMLGTGPTNTTPTERIKIKSNGNVGINEDNPQTKLNVRGCISTGRNVAREVGQIIDISSSYSGTRNGVSVINGQKNYEENTNADWITANGQRVNANLTIDLQAQYTCDRFVIYNQNEYANNVREVKHFTLEGSNDKSSWTLLLDDECGASYAHEPNPGFSFRIPSDFTDDDEGATFRYWRFTMKDYHGSTTLGGVMELELYEVDSSNKTISEVSTHHLSAMDITAQNIYHDSPCFYVAKSSYQDHFHCLGCNQSRLGISNFFCADLLRRSVDRTSCRPGAATRIAYAGR